MDVFNENNFLFNEDTNNHLETIVNSKMFANGYIFYGTEGLGKRQAALEFTKKIFKQYNPSEKLEEKINNNNHPDLLIIEPGSIINGKKRRSSDNEILKANFDVIKIDQIRNIKTFISQKSIESEKKIIIIVDAHLLNEASSNCLLKSLEEPINSIFILLTSKLNLLLDTIKSRCQLIQFKSLSKKEIDLFLKNNVEPNTLENMLDLTSQDLVNSSNGSPRKILNNIEIWKQLSDEIRKKLDMPLRDKIEILKLSKSISEELEIYQQIVLAQLIQQSWWRKTRSHNIIKILENLKLLIKGNCQTRLSWEVSLLKISLEDF